MSTFRRPLHLNQHAQRLQEYNHDQSGILKFHQSLSNYGVTPLHSLQAIASECRLKQVFIKDESERLGLQSFKILGASWGTFSAIATKLGCDPNTPIQELARMARDASVELMAATDGNHGLAVAHMAKLLAIPCRVFVPLTLDEHTRDTISAEGAVVLQSTTYDQAIQDASNAAGDSPGGILIQDTAFTGYEDIPDQIVQGYSTMLEEIEEELQDQDSSLDLVICPVGVGSLAHAVVTFFKSKPHAPRILTVEPDTAACLYQSLKAGEPKNIATSPTIMTGMQCGNVSKTAWKTLQETVDASLTVSDFEADGAIQDLKAHGVFAGPCGAAGLAALKEVSTKYRQVLRLSENSTVLLLNTEGTRSYTTPFDVSSDDAVSLTQILTRINSTNPSLSVSEGSGETEIANYIEAWLQHRDIETHRLESSLGRPSIIGVAHGIEDFQSLMINGHVDTVSISNYGEDPFSGRLDQKNGRGIIRGRGCLDMKAGLAAGMTAIMYASRNKSIGTVILAAVADEEDSSKGTVDVIRAGWRADGAVVPEPMSLDMGIAHKGFVWVEVEIHGYAAHGSQADLGVDAIAKSAQFLMALQKYAGELPEDEMLGKGTLHCGQIIGGDEPSTYPALCTVTIEFRMVPSQTIAGITDDLTKILESITRVDDQFKFAEPRVLLSRPPYSLEKKHPFARAAVSAAEHVMEKPVNMIGFPAWTDAALLGEAGMPAVVFGPGGEGIHGEEEWVETESIKTTEKMLLRLIEDFCHSKRPHRVSGAVEKVAEHPEAAGHPVRSQPSLSAQTELLLTKH